MPPQDSDVLRYAELARKYWPNPFGLLLAVLVASLAVTPILGAIKHGMAFNILVYLLLWGGILLSWFYTNSLPKTKKGKVGFLISISTGEEIERKKIKEDFVLTLHKLIKEGVSGRFFQLLEMPEYIANKILDPESAQALRLKCRAHFLVYGRVRLRTINAREEHVIELDGIVAHKPIPEEVQRAFSKEFGELLPRKLRIPTENDVFSFAFTSEWVNCVSKYIIGIAAACSGDLAYAEVLYTDVERFLSGSSKSFPIYSKLKERIPIRLAEVNEANARVSFFSWCKSHDPALIERMGLYLDKIPQSYADVDYGTLTLRSILLFLKYRDIKGAIAILKKCKHFSDGTWLYNLGFLYAYDGNLKKAAQCYRKAGESPTPPKVLPEIEEFIVMILEQEPEKYQLYYCLGIINKNIKGDSIQARADFETFLRLGNDREFTIERELARKWISEG